MEAERVAREKAEQERLARERTEAQRLAAQKAEAERVAWEKVEQERKAREKAEQGARQSLRPHPDLYLDKYKKRLAREKAEQERPAREERAEQERLEREPAVPERLPRVETPAPQPMALPKIAGKKIALIASLVVVLVVGGFAVLFGMNSQRSDTTPTVPAAALALTSTPVETRVFTDGAPMVFVPAGEFTMGSSDADSLAFSNEKPQHMVFLDSFWMDKFEATNAQYKKCVDARKCAAPRDRASSTRTYYYGNSQFDDYPVVYVAWNDAKNYCEWAGKRLPTEAEWEEAAHGMEGRIYSWGNTFDASKLNSSDGKRGDTTAVGSYLAGASPYEIMDLAGNVWEWVADWYDEKYYANSPRNNPTGPSSGLSRVMRGGAWDSNQNKVRAAVRSDLPPTTGYFVVGFRCARSP